MAGKTGRRLSWFGLWCVVGASWAIQVDFVPRLKILAKEAGKLTGARPAGRDLLDLAFEALGPASLAAIAVGTLGVLVALWFEFRGRHLTGILREAFSEDGRSLALLTLVAAFALRTYFDPGVPQAFDAKQHYAKVVVATDLLGQGAWPGWTWRWYAGFPLLRFYGPVFYVCSGLLGSVLSSPATGVKLVLLICHLASVRAVWSLVNLLAGSRRAAAFSAHIYLLAFPRFHSILELGRLPEAPLFLLFPLLLLLIERSLRGPTLARAAAGGLILALMVLSHPMLGALGGCLAAAYGLVRVVFLGKDRPALLDILQSAAFAGILSLALTAFWLLPSVIERPAVLLNEMYSSVTTSLLPLTPGGPMRLVPLAVNPLLSASTGNLSCLGLSVLVFYFIGLVHSVRRDPRRGWPLLLISGLTLLYLLGPYFQSRAILYFLLFVSVGAGMGLASLRVPRALEAALPAILIVNLLPMTIKAPFRPDLSPVGKELAALEPALGTGRAIVASRRGDEIRVSQWMPFGELTLAGPGGPFREGASSVYPWHMSLLDRVGHELNAGGELTPITVAACRVFGIRIIAVEDGFRLVPAHLDGGTSYEVHDDPPYAEISSFAPAVFASELIEAPIRLWPALPPLFELPGDDAVGNAWRERLETVVSAMGVSPTAPVAKRIYVDRLPRAGTPGRWEDATLELRDESINHTSVTFRVHSPANGFLQLSFAEYPGVRVYREEREIEARRSLTGHLVIPVPEGWSRIRIDGPVLSTHAMGRWISLVGLIALITALAWRRRPR